MQSAPNIVQAEFFHVGGDIDAPLHNVVSEALNRTFSGLIDIAGGIDPSEVRSGIKTCVRFYDADGSLTRFALQAQHARKEQLALLEKLKGATGLRRQWLRFRLIKVTGKITDASSQEYSLTVRALEKYVRQKKAVGIETFDHRYRALRDNERHELLESVRSSKHLWLFLMAHNDNLYDDDNKVIAHVM